MLRHEFKNLIEDALGQNLILYTPLATTDHVMVYRVTTADEKSYVAKFADKDLMIEAFMLNYLHEQAKMPTPQILHSEDHLMIMEYIPTSWHLDRKAERDAARLLAQCHDITSDQFGFERDTVIGGLKQPNTQNTSWLDFFIKERLFYMGSRAMAEGKLDGRIFDKIEKLASKMGDLLPNDSKPCLIHGDAWVGNILAGQGKINAFVDPAIYYADPEIEIAFTTLFHSFSDHFYQTYHEIRPLDKDFYTSRKDIYLLYPLLVHCRLFGRSYARKVEKILDQFV